MVTSRLQGFTLIEIIITIAILAIVFCFSLSFDVNSLRRENISDAVESQAAALMLTRNTAIDGEDDATFQALTGDATATSITVPAESATGTIEITSDGQIVW